MISVKKILPQKSRIVFAAAFCTLILLPQFAHAQVGALTAVALSPITISILTVSYIVTWGLGVVVAIIAWFIEILFRLNGSITASPIVTSGFPVTLSLANLGFVLGIVVIAVMTIIRKESYAIKQTLWKLVLMALLVNFGLVIAGTILNFSDSLTLYWLRSAVQSTTTASSLDPYQNFASRFTGIFQPQRAQLPISGPSDRELLQDSNNSWLFNFTKYFFENASDRTQELTNVFTDLNSSVRAILASIIGLFIILFTIIVLATFVVMLMARYFYLGILLVLLPLAWASWVFPGINKMGKWWDKFIQQTFFAPVVVFFLWLAMQLSSALESNRLFDFAAVAGSPGNNGAFETVKAKMTATFIPIIGYAFQGIMVCAITLVGLITARNMGVEFAGAGIKAAQSAAKGFGSYVGRRAGGRIAREATGTQPKPTTRAGQALRAMNPFTWAGKGVGLAANTEYAKSRGYNEALKQYGKKTDFSTPRRLWAEAKTHQEVAGNAAKLAEGIKVETRTLNELQEKLKTSQVESEKKDIAEKIATQEAAVARLRTVETTMRQRAKENLKIDAASAADLAQKAGDQSNQLKEKTWEAYGSNRGVAGSTFFGALNGAGLWKGKSKLKLDKSQIEAIAAASGVSLGGGAAAPKAP